MTRAKDRTGAVAVTSSDHLHIHHPSIEVAAAQRRQISLHYTDKRQLHAFGSRDDGQAQSEERLFPQIHAATSAHESASQLREIIMPPPKRLCLLFTVFGSIAFTILLSLRFLHHAIDERGSLGTAVHVVREKSTPVPNLVIAYSLWGSEARYITGMINVCRTHAQIYPTNWKIRIYHDNTVPTSIIDNLNEMEHVQLINVEKELPAWVKNNLNPMR